MANFASTAAATAAYAAYPWGGTGVPLTNLIRQVYSAEILFEAEPILRFAQFAQRRTELMTQPGQSIRFLTYNNLPLGGRLTEGIPMNRRNLSTSFVDITVWEYGNAIQITELGLHVTFDDTMGSAAILLGRDYAMVVDLMLRNALYATVNVIWPNNRTGRNALRAGIDVFDTTVVRDAVEALKTNNSPLVNGDSYICFIHPHQGRHLRDDTRWQSVSDRQLGGTQIFRGEIGRYENVRFIETTQMRIISGSPGDVYQAVIFGENAFGWAIALPVELRDDGVHDFGRIHGLAWYAIMGAGLLTEDNVFRLETL